nr:unnamed protein product [Digitaria exilis]
MAKAFSSSLAHLGTFRAHPAGRLRGGASGRFVACSSPPPDVVVTRERGKNAKLIAALLESGGGGRTNGSDAAAVDPCLTLES